MNLYEVHLSDGRSYEVRTPNHHSDHDDEVWKRHMIDILKRVVAGVTVQVIVRTIYKGKH